MSGIESDKESTAPAPFFVIGAPRSGTTMLQMALNRHSKIVIPPETAFFTLLTRSQSGQALHWRRIEKDLNVTLPDKPAQLKAGLKAASVFQQLLTGYAAGIGKPCGDLVFGEKSPEHQRRVSLIQKTFPDAKFVLIFRDGRDVACSLTKVPFMPGDLHVGFELWRHYFRIQRQLRDILADKLCVVQYETLVNNPEAELNRIQEFLGLPAESTVATGAGNKSGIPNHEVSFKERAMQPISTSRSGNWKTELTSRQIEILEARGGKELTELGYELSTEAPRHLGISYLPVTGFRIARWLIGRSIAQGCDQYLGTAWNAANHTLRH